MKNRVVIRKFKQKTSDVTASSVFEYKGFKFALQDNGDVVKLRIGDKEPPTRDMVFDSLHQEIVYDFETESKGGELKGVTPEDERQLKAVNEFWKRHPLCVNNGVRHDNTKMELFDVVDKTAQVSKSYSEWENKLTAANFVKGASLETLRNISYYFGDSPADKTEQDLRLDIADYATGSAMRDLSTFIYVWVAGDSAEREFIVNAHKAVRLGIVTNRPEGGRDNYYHGQVFLGSRIEDVVIYFKREKQIYETSILREIAERDSFVKEEKSTKEMTNLDTNGSIEEKEALLARGKQLKDEGFIRETANLRSMGFSKLQKLVQDAEAEAVAAKAEKV